MSEKEAWQLIADAKIVPDYANYVLEITINGHTFTSPGLCFILTCLPISNGVKNSMLKKLECKYTSLYKGFYWPRTEEGQLERKQFAKEVLLNL